MRRPRLHIQSMLLLIAVLASGLGAYVWLARRIAYCHERADFYEASANTMAVHARFGATELALGIDPGSRRIAQYNDAAVEWGRRSARFRLAAWRPWVSLPLERGLAESKQPQLPCPDDITDNRTIP
jgi:hypothetical protein